MDASHRENYLCGKKLLNFDGVYSIGLNQVNSTTHYIWPLYGRISLNMHA
jgi:hypothetical protein